jgi:magnesium transporter
MIQFDTILEPFELLDILREAELDPKRREEFKRLLRTQPEPVVDAAFEEASRDERLEFLRLMPVERAATTFTDLPLPEQADSLPDLAADRLRVMGAFIGPDEVADLLGELGDDPRRDYLLNSLPPTLAKSARELERYDEDDAGGIMTPEYVALREGTTVAQAIAFLRQAADHAETVTNLYLVNAKGQLTGVIQLQALVTGAPNARIDDLARREVIFAKTDTDQEEVARLMRDYDLAVLPVVDADGVLKGIVTIDDVLDVVQEEATEDIYKGMAMEGSEIDYLRTSPFVLWRKRVIWLAALAISETLTASVISSYENVLAANIALNAYIPTLIGTGGNTGSQSAVLIVRAISTGQLRGRDAWRVALKEVATGALLGLALGAFAFARAFFLRRDIGLATTVAITMGLIIVVANLLGGLLPIAFTKLKIDPAVTSSPFLATLMDATGLIIYFTVAKFVLHV